MKKKYKITVPFIDEEGYRIIEAFNLQTGYLYTYYDVEVGKLHEVGLIALQKYLQQRMHLIKAGAYDDFRDY